MSNYHRGSRRSVSNIVAELMLILVTLAAGFLFLGYYYSALSQYTSQTSVSAFKYLQYLEPSMAWYSDGHIYVTFYTSPYGVEVYYVTINESQASCLIKVGSNTYRLPALLPASSMGYVLCNSSGPGTVTIGTGGGEVSVYAGP